MGIQIINQTNEQECGVCVLTTLHNHFYKNQIIEKQQVLDESNISNNGMSIFDFEIVAKKLGLDCESYEVTWSEFIDLKINSYFVLLVSINNGQNNHYVIAKKHKKYIEIYDSCSYQVNKLKYDDIKKVYLNVIILISKKPNKLFNGVFAKPKTLLLFDLKYVILNIVLSLLILIASVCAASYLNWLIEYAIQNSSIRNVLTISFIFVFIYFSNDLLTYITQLYTSSHLKNYMLLFTNKIIGSLANKKSSFIDKVDKNWIYKLDECVYNLSNFCVLEINKFITNVIFSVLCICMIGIIQYYLLIFALIIPLIQLIFFVFEYRKKKDVYLNIVRAENKNLDNYKKLISFIGNEIWYNKKDCLISEIKNNHSYIYKNFNDATLFKNNVLLFRSLAKSIIEIALILTLCVLIINKNKITIGLLTFVISTFSLYKNSTSELYGYFLARLEFNIYWQVYKDITEVDNLKEENLIQISDEIKSISFINNNFKQTFVLGKDNISKIPIHELFLTNNQISINDQIFSLNNKHIQNSIILCDENTEFDYLHFIKLFKNHPETYSQFLRYFNIDLNKQNQPLLKKIVLNLLCLFEEQNKIIFIDSILDILPKQDLIMIKNIINKIQKNNNVFIVRKETYD